MCLICFENMIGVLFVNHLRTQYLWPERMTLFIVTTVYGRHVDYYDRWNEQAEISLHKLLVDSNVRFMLSTWDHNDYR